MKLRYSVPLALACLLQVLLTAEMVLADRLELADGTSVEGIVQKIEKGKVTIAVGAETKVFEVLDITGIDFNTPHLTTDTSRLPLEHFLGSMEAQEMVGHFQAVEESAAAVRQLIDQTKKEWANQKTILPAEAGQWAAAKESCRKPLSRYQEVLNDLYFHVLGKVDEYNLLMEEANSIRVGVRGWFQTGSSLIPSDMEKLPLKKYVPANWYDTIYFDGYEVGYRDAFEKYRDEPF